MSLSPGICDKDTGTVCLRILLELLVLTLSPTGPRWLKAHMGLPISELCPGAMNSEFGWTFL